METVSLSLQNLKRAKDLSSLAEVLGVQPTTLSFLLYKLPTEHRYRRFTIPKANGGVREICAPEPRLKFVQSQLSNLLLEIEQQLESVRKRECILAHGFKKNLSIVSNAKNHRNRRFVFNVDLKDFFPSINFGRVRGFFIKNRDFQLEPSVATVIAQIACHENMLPQGSPSSPIIANFVANILDIHLNRLARKHHCTYTRYADDLTFSTNKKAFPTAIARLTTSSFNGWEAGDELASRVSRAGFSLTRRKHGCNIKTLVSRQRELS